MSKTAHTPGPWHVSGFSDRDGQFLHISAKSSIMVLASMNAVHTHTEANARLIAAAPELLAALQQIVREDDSFEEFQVALEAGRAAIAKATGAA